MGLHCGSVANNRIAVAIHQKFGEVPFDGPAAQYAGRLLHKPLIERVREWTVHVDLLDHRAGHRIVLMTEGGDLIRSSRLLMKALIAGKAKHRETAGRIVRIKLLQPPLQRGEAALASRIHDHPDIAANAAPRNYTAFYLLAQNNEQTRNT